MAAQPNQIPTDQSVKAAIKALLAEKGLKDLVGLYFDGMPQTDFAGHLFDTIPDNPPERVVASDLVAVSLLDVSFGPMATDALLNRAYLDSHLAVEKLPINLDLWDAIDRVNNLYAARKVLDDLHDVGPVKASKLLARKRPRLVPITDRHVEVFFGCRGWEFLTPLATCLSENSDLVGAINALSPSPSESGHSPTTLRLLDVAIWMTRSRSASAKKARKAALGDSRALDLRSSDR